MSESDDRTSTSTERDGGLDDEDGETPGPVAGMTAIGSLGHALQRRLPRVEVRDQDAMMDDLIPQDAGFPSFLWRFGSLIVLSSAIAAFGLLADSSAVVIGAMLVAPLMTPILGTAASICIADNRRLVRALLVLAGGTVIAIVVGVVIARISGNAVVSADNLPEEVLARTQPGLLDLGIAVAAGAAGGYVAPRRDATSALPGVGIAVALVPPLAAVGITLEAGASHQAGGALLLYLTNLAAIVFSGALMLLAAGIRPPEVSSFRTVTRGLLLTVAAVVAVAVPLTLHTIQVLEDTRFNQTVTEALTEWDDTVTVLDLATDVDDGRGTVDLRIAAASPSRPAWELAELIAAGFGGPVDLSMDTEAIVSIEVSTR